MCHLAMTYDIIFPFLIGFHLTLCSHLPQRNEEGWKIKELEWLAYCQQAKIPTSSDLKHPNPTTIQVVPRFFDCLEALTLFFKPDDPPIVTERSTNIRILIYGFVDGSKSGFGASLKIQNSIKYRIGTWDMGQR